MDNLLFNGGFVRLEPRFFPFKGGERVLQKVGKNGLNKDCYNK
ncbi:hypothetical protein BpPP18_32550 [Weizmannia acidilactici]|nr:hypothetical protein BpPP18_32550 [Weizmannia acidilactici]